MEPALLTAVPEELVRAFEWGSVEACHAYGDTSWIASEDAYIRGGITAVLACLNGAEQERDAARATIARLQAVRAELANGPWTGASRDYVIERLDAALADPAGGGDTG